MLINLLFTVPALLLLGNAIRHIWKFNKEVKAILTSGKIPDENARIVNSSYIWAMITRRVVELLLLLGLLWIPYGIFIPISLAIYCIYWMPQPNSVLMNYLHDKAIKVSISKSKRETRKYFTK